jgi:O-antigen/teichoic acid export membrane protein
MSNAFHGLTGRAVAISATRLMNYGLVLISPMILVRLLSIEEFGSYREFLVYVGLVGGVASFGINTSLLRFVPIYPQSTLQFVNQSAVMTFVSSVIVTGCMLVLDALFGGDLVGHYAIPVALYVMLSVNMDFWEFLWLAERRSSAVLRYTTARLIARIATVTTVAILTRDVATVIWSLICLESARLIISTIGWRVRARTAHPEGVSSWREQWKYCLPFGTAMVFNSVNVSIGALFIAKMMGPAALAHFTIGTYLQPVTNVVRNSLSDVILPEMASRAAKSQADPLQLWRRTTVVTAIILFGASVLLARFADVLVVTLFSEEYRPAVLIFQIYLLVFLRQTLDFGIPLRALNRNAPILHANVISLVVRVVLMIFAIPLWGLLGAVVAIVIARFAEGAYLAFVLAREYKTPLRLLAPWKDLVVILCIAVLAGAVLMGEFWTDRLGILGLIPAGVVYVMAYALLLWRTNIPEVGLLLEKLRSAPAVVLRRS